MHLIKQINFFNWLGIYEPLLEKWRDQDLNIEKIEKDFGFPDPVKHRVQFSYHNKKHNIRLYGYGEDNIKMFAMEKAIVELYEREQLFEDHAILAGKSSNGIAGHRFLFLAKDVAKNELIERDAFLRHWLTKTPFREQSIDKFKDLAPFQTAIYKQNHKLLLYETFLGCMPTALAVIINQKTRGFLLGSSANKNFNTAAYKAVKEVFYSFSFGKYDPNTIINFENFKLADHRNYWYLKRQLPDWFNGGSGVEISKSYFVPRTPIYHVILVERPVPVVAAFCPDLIDLWVGKTPLSVLQKVSEQYENIVINEDFHPFP